MADYKSSVMNSLLNWEFTTDDMASTKVWLARWLENGYAPKNRYDKRLWGEVLNVMADVLNEDRVRGITENLITFDEIIEGWV